MSLITEAPVCLDTSCVLDIKMADAPAYVAQAIEKWDAQCARRSTSSALLPTRDVAVAVESAITRWIAEAALSCTATRVLDALVAERRG